MRRSARLLLLLITALWLPLQAVAGIVMPFSRLASEQPVPAEPMSHDAPCHGQMSGGTETVPAPSFAAEASLGHDCDQGCDDCGVCHLASSGYMPATDSRSADLPVTRTYVVRPVLASLSFIPEPLQHPPLRLS
ncbi:MAG: hypothetical protein KJ787_01720 [Gammaproteobacteria bacterium]|nr:hypothetical protein [Gammaproteobacteria bacterium]MBU1645034.1 hypothetical protein [Gammaproteobacteria bacterium]MBU1973271.1 hypothetical protein [Gammaproteobacteria bacterium]